MHTRQTSDLPRATWTALTDEQLLDQCDVDTYRASGPGGQKRNKTSSAVRLRHGPTGLLVIAEESRSQHENKAKALKRLRRTLYLELRDGEPTAEHPEFVPALVGGRLSVTPRDGRFWPAAGVVLDALTAHIGRVSDAAASLGVTTANLIAFAASDPNLWQAVNRIRSANGHKQLKLPE